MQHFSHIFLLKLFQILAKLMKDIYATLVKFLTQLKKLYIYIYKNHPSISILKKMVSTKILSFPSSLLPETIYHNK